jgi:hypothetical protein
LLVNGRLRAETTVEIVNSAQSDEILKTVRVAPTDQQLNSRQGIILRGLDRGIGDSNRAGTDQDGHGLRAETTVEIVNSAQSDEILKTVRVAPTEDGKVEAHHPQGT